MESTMENGHEPATKADLQQLGESAKADLQQLGEQLRSEFQHGFDDLKETMRDGQTEILRAFYSFAESNQTRLTGTERESAALKERIGILERRLTEVERRVNFPNHPTQ
jgi:hypothetical protein